MKRYVVLILCLLSACSRFPDQVVVGNEVMVDLSLHISEDVYISCTDQFETQTKADDILNGNDVNDVVKNFWIAQYNGVTDAAMLVGEAKYFVMDDFMKPSDQGGNNEQIKLVASEGENLLVIIANTFDGSMDFPQGSTLADLKKKLRTIEDDTSIFSYDDTDKYLVMSGAVKGQVLEGKSFTCALQRNVAKVSIRVVNSSSDVTIKSWQLRSVPSISYYYTDYVLPEIYPAVGEFIGVDYPLIIPETSLSKGDYFDYISYVPVNKWGYQMNVTNQEYKNEYAPKGATYFEINAVSNDGQPLVYKFYLGKNMTTDFNILPNTSYSFTFYINSAGDAEYDSRVEYPALINFANANDETANCYVINPAEINGVIRRFRIPVKRVDEFWGGRGYENAPANTLSTDKEWVVELIACNFDNSDNKLSFTKNEGRGSYNPVSDELQYFEVMVKPDTEGNAVVALRKKGEGNPILWSWHLWITQYSPDQAYENDPVDGVYAYPVTGGVVHRYEGSIWHGEYARRFIMDRNLGSPSVSFLNAGNGAIYYQFGRKDPMFANFTSTDFSRIHSPSDPTATIAFSIANPLVFINHSDAEGRKAWTEGNKYNPEIFDGSIAWQDPNTSTKLYPSTTVGKSIFDPCPPGYCIPKSGTWEDFRRNDYDRPTTNISEQTELQRGFKSFSSVNGCLYWPYPLTGNEDVLPSEEVVFYPLTGYKEGSGVSSQSTYLYSLSSTPLDYMTCVGMTVSYTPALMNMSSNYALGRNLALPVRCITSRDAE